VKVRSRARKMLIIRELLLSFEQKVMKFSAFLLIHRVMLVLKTTETENRIV